MSPTSVLVHGVQEQASEQPGGDDRPSASPERPTLVEWLGATLPLISAPALFGPPVVFILGPWLLLVLLIIPPAAVLITLVLVVLLGAGLLAAVAAVAAVIASPYLLVRHLLARHRLARPAPAVGESPVKQSVRPRLVHLTTR
jgi:hypothetical protein